MKKVKFGDLIKFDEIFYDVVYIKNDDLETVKLYEHDEFNIMETTVRKLSKSGELGILEKKKHYPSSLRKIIFLKQNGEGVVIGQKTKKEGFYSPGSSPSAPHWDDHEQSWLTVTKTYTFWIVAVGMNQTKLVPKNTTRS